MLRLSLFLIFCAQILNAAPFRQKELDSIGDSSKRNHDNNYNYNPYACAFKFETIDLSNGTYCDLPPSSSSSSSSYLRQPRTSYSTSSPSSFPHIYPKHTLPRTSRYKSTPFASSVLPGKQPVYISLTTISSRLFGIADTVSSILAGTLLPTHIYIVISRDPYLLDEGVDVHGLRRVCGKIKEISDHFPHLSVIYTENLGPHRKLLPLLSQKWKEDCVIITIDDHEIYPLQAISTLIHTFIASGGNAVVALRSRRMGICSDSSPLKLSPYTRHRKGLWPESTHTGRRGDICF